jgi:hypothetical protein
VELCEDSVLVRDEVDDAIGNDDLEGLILKRQTLGLAFDELDVRRAHLACGSLCLRQHLGRHVDPCHPPGLADHLRRDERIRPRTRAQVEDTFTGRQAAELPRVRYPREGLDGPIRNVRKLARVAKVFCPRPPGRKMKSRSGSAETEAYVF